LKEFLKVVRRCRTVRPMAFRKRWFLEDDPATDAPSP
jgi:hypothetical protein